jgi:hypothetical protein
LQSLGQLTYLRPYVDDFTPTWLVTNSLALTAGAMALVYLADTINELKLGQCARPRPLAGCRHGALHRTVNQGLGHAPAAAHARPAEC